MGDREHPRCHCGSLLRIHCGSTTCTWHSCRNNECDVVHVDLEAQRWRYRDGRVETMPS